MKCLGPLDGSTCDRQPALHDGRSGFCVRCMPESIIRNIINMGSEGTLTFDLHGCGTTVDKIVIENDDRPFRLRRDSILLIQETKRKILEGK